MSRLSYSKSLNDKRPNRSSPTLTDFIHALPAMTIAEMEQLAITNAHITDQLPRYLSEMVSLECRIIGF